MADIDRFPVKDLSNRYSVGRTALYERFKVAGIFPEKDGTRSYISREQLQELDRLDNHIKSGGKLENFKSKLPVNEVSIAVVSSNGGEIEENNLAETLALVEAIAKHFSQPQDLMAEYKALIFAVENKLLLPSSKIQQLIGTKPKGEIFQYGSFNFVRSGKIGNQSAWLVEKA